MKISIILGHPKTGSFNHAIAETAAAALKKKGHEVFYHDLYREKFDANFTEVELTEREIGDKKIKRYCDELVASDGIIVVHPNWWGQPPAILKGWVDRVIRQGVAYRFGTNDKGEGVPIGLLRAKRAIVFNTSNTPEAREREVFGDPLDGLWKKCIFEFCGINDVRHKMFGVVIISTVEQRKAWLREVEDAVAEAF